MDTKKELQVLHLLSYLREKQLGLWNINNDAKPHLLAKFNVYDLDTDGKLTYEEFVK